MRLLMALLLLTASAFAQELPSRWDELTAADWPAALERSA
jgi:creatinine amidohydrolase